MRKGFPDIREKVIKLAGQEARELKYGYIGTEHILLALMKMESGDGVVTLKNLNLDYKKVKLKIEDIVKTVGESEVIKGELPQTPRAKEVMDNALEYARSLNHAYVGTGHILYGLLAKSAYISFQVLTDLGLGKGKVIGELEKSLNIKPSGLLGAKALRESIQKHVSDSK